MKEDREDLLREEERNIRRLRFIVDLTGAILMQANLSIEESLTLIDKTKKAAMGLFPDKESVYDLIYTPRFQRIIHERFTICGTFYGKN